MEGQFLGGKFMGVGCSTSGGLVIRSCQVGIGSFRNAFPSNLDTVNLKIFASQVGIFT